MRTAIFTGLTFGLLAISQAHAIVIQPNEAASKDVLVYEGVPTANFNSGPPFSALLASSKTGTGHNTQTLLEFNLATVPYSAAQVTSATISLFTVNAASVGFGANPTSTFSIIHDLRPISATWNEDSAAWTGDPVGPPITVTKPAAGSVVASVTQTGIGAWITFDVTDLVKDWLDGSLANFGVLIEQRDVVLNGSSQKVVGVFSSASGANAPMLTVVPEPATSVLAMFASVSLAWLARRTRRGSVIARSA